MNKFSYMDNVFDLKPLPEKTFKDLLIDNATDLWDKGEECVVTPSSAIAKKQAEYEAGKLTLEQRDAAIAPWVGLENELLEVLCKPENQPDHPYIHDALIIGADSGDFEQLLIAFMKDNPKHPLAIHVDKSLRGYLPLVIEAKEQVDNTISEAFAEAEQAWISEDNRYDYDL